MKNRYCSLLLFFFIFGCFQNGHTQDTFSIVAVDSETGEVGSAGATCLDDDDIAGGAVIISKLYPGKGAVNTQSFWSPDNQENAGTLVGQGLEAQEIIDWLEANDVDNNPTRRQYGVAILDEDNSTSAAGFTGSDCFDEKTHTADNYYSIQGNILLSEDIVTSMESAFLNAQGSLAEKLMASLQGANVPGADSRCLQEGVSSQSAFVRVARPDDEEGSYYLDIVVSKTPFGYEPIDSVQALFDEWALINETVEEPVSKDLFKLYPNPVRKSFTVEYEKFNSSSKYTLEILDSSGKLMQVEQINKNRMDVQLKGGELPQGQYFYTFKENRQIVKQSSFIVINK